jgi:hypothetical protein
MKVECLGKAMGVDLVFKSVGVLDRDGRAKAHLMDNLIQSFVIRHVKLTVE